MVQKRDLSSEKIVQTAIDLVTEGNSESATLVNIAKKLDCKTQALYFYFKNRDDLNLAIAQRYIGDLQLLLQEKCFGLSGKKGLVKLANVMRQYGMDNLSLALLVVRVAALKQNEIVGKHILTINEMMEKFMSDFISDPAQQMTVTRGIRGLVMGEVLNEGIGFFDDPLIRNTVSFENNIEKLLAEK
jgi:AcrR family transcriptional regulator